MSYKVAWELDKKKPATILVVGCGGTGGFVAEGLCRLLAGGGFDILLVDHDRVEQHNLKRQNFFEGDIGKFKSQALAERLSRHYGRRLGYSVMPFDPEMLYEKARGYSRALDGLIIGCVDDSTDARRLISESMENHINMRTLWWLDAGNGHHSGQVLIGNAPDVKYLGGVFDKGSGIVSRLPIPSLQAPSLLIQPTKNAPQEDCAELVETEDQSPVINQAMSAVVLQFVNQLIKGNLTWMGAYIDLEADIPIQTVPADPVTVARMLSVKVDTLFADEDCHVGMRMRTNSAIARANSFI